MVYAKNKNGINISYSLTAVAYKTLFPTADFLSFPLKTFLFLTP